MSHHAKRMRYAALIACILCSNMVVLFAQSTFIKQYDRQTNKNDLGKEVIQTSDGGYLTIAQTQKDFSPDKRKLTLIKTDANGNILWEKIIDDVAPSKLIAAGGHHNAVIQNGLVDVWGINDVGQLGRGYTTVGTYDPFPQPAKINPALKLNNITQVDAGSYFTLALAENGKVYAWGSSAYGECGHPITSPTLDSFAVTVKKRIDTTLVDLDGITDISAGGVNNINPAFQGHALAIKCDGTVYAWGYNGEGAIGAGIPATTTTAVVTASKVLKKHISGTTSLLTDVIGISAGGEHSLAVTRDGQVWAWGSNTYRQSNASSTPLYEYAQRVYGMTQGTDLSGCIAVAGGGMHSLALSSTGTVYMWGWNGLTTAATFVVPLPTRVTAIAAGAIHSLALGENGEVWSWGRNVEYQLGRPTVSGYESIPGKVLDINGNPLTDIVAISSQHNYNLALSRTGQVYVWGTSSPLGFTPMQYSERAVVTTSTISSVESRTDMQAWAIREIADTDPNYRSYIMLGTVARTPQCEGNNMNDRLLVVRFKENNTNVIVEWVKAYSGLNNYNTLALDIEQTFNQRNGTPSGFIIAGKTNVTAQFQAKQDYVGRVNLIKLTNDGQVSWAKYYTVDLTNPSAPNAVPTGWAYSVEQTFDTNGTADGFVMAGTVTEEQYDGAARASLDGFIMKVSDNGTYQNSRIFRYLNPTWAARAKKTSDGYYITTVGDGYENNRQSFWLLKMDQNFDFPTGDPNVFWTYVSSVVSQENYNVWGKDLVEVRENNAVTGYAVGGAWQNGTPIHGALHRFDMQGDLSWTKEYGEIQEVAPYGTIMGSFLQNQTTDGGFVFTSGSRVPENILLVKTDINGKTNCESDVSVAYTHKERPIDVEHDVITTSYTPNMTILPPVVLETVHKEVVICEVTTLKKQGETFEIGNQQSDLLSVDIADVPVQKGNDVILHIASERAGEVSLSVIDMMGRIIYEGTSPVRAGRTMVTLPLKNAAAGAYMVHIQNAASTVSSKLIIVP